MKAKPILTKDEDVKILNFLTRECVVRYNTTQEQGEKRMRALLDSGELDGLLMNDPKFRIIVDTYCKKPVK